MHCIYKSSILRCGIRQWHHPPSRHYFHSCHWQQRRPYIPVLVCLLPAPAWSTLRRVATSARQGRGYSPMSHTRVGGRGAIRQGSAPQPRTTAHCRQVQKPNRTSPAPRIQICTLIGSVGKKYCGPRSELVCSALLNTFWLAQLHDGAHFTGLFFDWLRIVMLHHCESLLSCKL